MNLQPEQSPTVGAGGPLDQRGRVVVITGGANGLGAAAARRFAARGGHVVIGDVDEEAGAALAHEIGGRFQSTDVREPSASVELISFAESEFGGVDTVLLNAGVATGCGLAESFDEQAYRRAMGINLDGVVFGLNAAVPALRRRGGGDIVITASMAGLVPVPFDPIYGANKHAVVGFARSAGQLYAPEGIRVNALCPSFAETAIIADIRPFLESTGFPILEVEAVIDTLESVLASKHAGECWFVISGRESEPFRFRNAPGHR